MNSDHPKRQKRFYAAAEVARLLGVEPHVIRYWERKFEITPTRNSAGRRIYTAQQLDKLATIRFLRYSEGLTIKAVKTRLKSLSSVAQRSATKSGQRVTMLWIRRELTEIRDMLRRTPPACKGTG